jgi:hypothetical protein
LPKVAATTASSKVASPRKNSVAYYVDWLQELSELHSAGMVSDEDFAFSRAERLDALFHRRPKPWRKWLWAGVPAALATGGVGAHLAQALEPLMVGAAVSTLCILAAVGTHSRVMASTLDFDKKLSVLRDLLARDLVSADEFSDFEQRIREAH